MRQDKAGPRAGLKVPSSCAHGRMVADEYTKDYKRTGNVVCRECGAVVPDRSSNAGH